MHTRNKIAVPGGLLLAGVGLLIAGQVWLGQGGDLGIWGLAGGVLLLVGAAGLAWRQRAGRGPQPRLVGEYRGVLASEEGFVPLATSGEEQRRQVQRRIVDKPQRAADSVRGLIEQQIREAKGGGRVSGRDTGKRRKKNG
jgi:hypothetical protein